MVRYEVGDQGFYAQGKGLEFSLRAKEVIERFRKRSEVGILES